jgi:hypothetical protein
VDATRNAKKNISAEATQKTTAIVMAHEDKAAPGEGEGGLLNRDHIASVSLAACKEQEMIDELKKNDGEDEKDLETFVDIGSKVSTHDQPLAKSTNQIETIDLEDQGGSTSVSSPPEQAALSNNITLRSREADDLRAKLKDSVSMGAWLRVVNTCLMQHLDSVVADPAKASTYIY